MKKRFIYALKCPFTNDIHYIGKSTNGMISPLEHLTKSHSKKVIEWVDELKILGYKPNIEILESVSLQDNLEERERYWIQKYINEGVLLLNTTLVSPTLISTKLDKLLGNLEYKDISNISGFIKERRKLANLTQEEFAYKCGVALSVLKKIEQNKTNVNLDNLLLILNMFGCTIEVKKLVRE